MKRWKRWSWIMLALAVGGGAAAPPPAAAQLPFDFEVRLAPRTGLLTPADWFYEEFPHFGAGDLEWTEAVIRKSAVVGLAMDVELEGIGVRLRGEFLRTLSNETWVTYAILRPPAGFNPPRVDRTTWPVESALTFWTLDLVLPTRLRLPGGLQPYVMAGAGGKHYQFDITELETVEELIILPRDGTTLVVDVGAGLTFQIRGLAFDLLLRDAVSEYWEKQQHDVMVMGGVSVPVF